MTATETTPLLPEDIIEEIRSPHQDEDPQKPHDEENDFPETPNVSLAAIVPSLLIGVFLAAMDNLIVASVYGRIGSELNQLDKTSWIATSYLVTTTCFQPLYGKLSDIFGRKGCLLFAYVTFAIGSLWCGLARDMDELIIARAFAGIGGGGMTTLVSIIVSDIVPLHKRGTWQGLLNIVYAAGASSGAPMGGLLADRVGWRWAFLFQAPATLFAAFLVLICLNMPHNHPDASDRTTWEKFKRIDFLGALTLVTAVLLLLITLDRGGKVSWSDTVVLVTAPISAVLFIAFLLIETYVASDPFAPPRIVFDKGLLACYLSYFFSLGGFFASLFYLPLYYQAVLSLNAAQSGLRILPAVAGTVSGSLGGGLLMQKTGKYYVLTLVAYSVMVVGCVMVVLFTGILGRNFVAVGAGLAIAGFGSGVGGTTVLVALIARAGPRDQAVSTAVSYLFRSLGSVVGISLGSTLLQGSLRKDLRRDLEGVVDKGEVEEIVRMATGSLEFLKELEPRIRNVVVAAYEVAVRYPFVMASVYGVFAVVASIFVVEQPILKGKAASASSPASDSEDGAPTRQGSRS